MNKQHLLLKLINYLLVKLHKNRLHTEKGYTLFIVMMLSISSLALLTAYIKMTQVEQMSSTSSSDNNTAYYSAEAGLNLRVEAIRQKFAGYNSPIGSPPTSLQACFDSDSDNDGTGDFACQIEEFAKSISGQSKFEAASYVVPKDNGNPVIDTVPRGEPFENLTMQEYGFAIHSIAKKVVASDTQIGASLKMDIKSRLIPMFQFAAFYANDLEILPGPEMNLRGPVHTNGSLYLGANDVLNLHNQVTLAGDLYSKRKNNNSTYADGKVKIKDAAGNWLNLLFNGTGSTSQTTNAMDSELVQSAWGTQVQIGLDSVLIPSDSLTDTSGAYYEQADLRLNYKPADTGSNTTLSPYGDHLATVPFDIEVKVLLEPGDDGYVDGVDTYVYETLTEGQLRSLRQPVMVSRDLEQAGYCNAATAPDVSAITTNNEVKKLIVESLQTAITSQELPFQFTQLSTALNDSNLTDVKDKYEEMLTYLSTNQVSLGIATGVTLSDIFTTANLNALYTLSPAQIAAIAYDESGTAQGERCFVSAPLRDIGRDSGTDKSPYRYYNDREGREMRLLQMNMESLTIWNRDGKYVDFENGVVTNHNGGSGHSADELLFVQAAADNDATANSFQRLGLAAIDDTEGGLVYHATVDSSTYANAATVDSPYGFVLAEGQQLMGLATTPTTLDPTGLTFVSDQAIYVQGDYNTVNYQPAGILADSLNVLSNACQNQDEMVNKKSGRNCNPNIYSVDSKSDATTTTINTAFLSGTDVTNSAETSGYNGGLENYPRFAENWSGRTLTYRGSFVSLGTPKHVSGTWGNQAYSPPARDWEYDQQFNNASNLPPLTPRFVHVRQSAFERYLD